MLAAPFIGKAVDRLCASRSLPLLTVAVPWTAILIGIAVYLTSNAIETAAGGINLAAPILCMRVADVCCADFLSILVDIAMQFVQVASAAWFFQILPHARARANA